MRYWPLSAIRTSPLLPGACALELDSLHSKHCLSPLTSQICGVIADHTEPVTMDGLVIVDNEELQTISFAYAKRPAPGQERDRCHYVLMLYALH